MSLPITKSFSLSSYDLVTQIPNGSSSLPKGFAKTITDFGKEKVLEISYLDLDRVNVRLEGTTVERTVETEGDVIATGATIGRGINSQGKIILTYATVLGEVNATGNITANNSIVDTLSTFGKITIEDSKTKNMFAETIIARKCKQLGGIIATSSINLEECSDENSKKFDICSSGTITAKKCKHLGPLRTEGLMYLEDCSNISSVTSDTDITLKQSQIVGNVSALGAATIISSKIGGQLTCLSKHLVVENSQIDIINLKFDSSGGFVIRQKKESNSDLKPTDNGNITFFDFSSFTMQGVSIGPMQEGSPQVVLGGPPQRGDEKKNEASANKSIKEIRHILELNNSTVRRVIFEGGNGVVVLVGEKSKVGHITGGKIAPQSSSTI